MIPKATLVTPERTKLRITRGDSWELASWRATRVRVNTTPRKVSVEDAMMPRKPAASPGATKKPVRQAAGTPSVRASTVSTASTAPATSSIAGMTQNRSRIRSRAHSTR